MTISLRKEIPDPDTFLFLRRVAGLSDYERDAVKRGLQNSLFAVLLFDDDQPIGMGRVIGDGGLAIQVTDIALHPDYRGRGLGKRIVAALVDFIETKLPSTAYVSLIADLPADDLYRQFGFKDAAPASIGMYRRARA